MRVGHGYYFSAEELWRTTLSVIMAGYFLETQNRHIGKFTSFFKVPSYLSKLC